MKETAISAFSFRDVHIIFPALFAKPVHALRGLTLDIPRGAIVGLLGPNGSGKTTAISCLLGLLAPQVGEIRINGEQVLAYKLNPGYRYGVMLEDTRLPPSLSVRRALKLVCALRGFSKKLSLAEMERVIHETAIEDLLTRKVQVLSKGQARRVGLAAALIGDPELLILDEPSSGLDVSARREFDDLLRKLKNGRRTALIASHLLGDVENSCSHVAIMSAGVIRYFGEIPSLLSGLQTNSTSSVFIEQIYCDNLKRLGLQFQTSRYSNLVQIVTELSDADLLRCLLDAGLKPKRLEPKVDLVSMYIDLTKKDGEDVYNS